jgi:hypothetical protein
MAILRRFWRQNSGSSFESLALVLSVIAVISVGAADLLHYTTKKDGLLAHVVDQMRTQIAQVSHDKMDHAGIDYTPTGSIIGLRRSSAMLNPCNAAGTAEK